MFDPITLLFIGLGGMLCMVLFWFIETRLQKDLIPQFIRNGSDTGVIFVCNVFIRAWKIVYDSIRYILHIIKVSIEHSVVSVWEWIVRKTDRYVRVVRGRDGFRK